MALLTVFNTSTQTERLVIIIIISLLIVPLIDLLWSKPDHFMLDFGLKGTGANFTFPVADNFTC